MQGHRDDEEEVVATTDVNTETSNGSDIRDTMAKEMDAVRGLKPGRYPGVTFDDLIYTVIEYNFRLDKAHVVKERKPQRISLVCSSGANNCSFRAYAVRLKPPEYTKKAPITTLIESNTSGVSKPSNASSEPPNSNASAASKPDTMPAAGIRITQFVKHNCQCGPKRKRQLVVRRRKVFLVDKGNSNNNASNASVNIGNGIAKNPKVVNGGETGNKTNPLQKIQTPSIVSRIPVPTSISTPSGGSSSHSPSSGVIFPFPEGPPLTSPVTAPVPVPMDTKKEAIILPRPSAMLTMTDGTPLKKKFKRAVVETASYTSAASPTSYTNHARSRQIHQPNLNNARPQKPLQNVHPAGHIIPAVSTAISPSTSSLLHAPRIPPVRTPVVSPLHAHRQNTRTVHHQQRIPHLAPISSPSPSPLPRQHTPSNNPAPKVSPSAHISPGVTLPQSAGTATAIAPRGPSVGHTGNVGNGQFSVPPPVLSHVMYTAIPVLWTGRALAFWQDVVGLRVIGDGTVESGITLGVGGGATRIYLYTVKQLPQNKNSDCVLTLGCPDVHACVSALRARGTHIIDAPAPFSADPRVIRASFRDSEGNTIRLQGLAPPHPN